MTLPDLSNLKDNLKKKGSIFPLYLDNQSTTKIDSRVLEYMNMVYENDYGNPHSRSHSYGFKAEAVCEIARKQVAELIGADPKRLYLP
ncbi:MAG TPA: aminotransferase class V-fold PLP-dependent enzyme, partial [Candidatus Megaira endosymbiont of Hartmannula sinica]|nr:aminotransferase class V-fold PLP-dependent enzyme [Candidatus Megaera endosymbiont of Hartmannula sinica]